MDSRLKVMWITWIIIGYVSFITASLINYTSTYSVTIQLIRQLILLQYNLYVAILLQYNFYVVILLQYNFYVVILLQYNFYVVILLDYSVRLVIMPWNDALNINKMKCINNFKKTPFHYYIKLLSNATYSSTYSVIIQLIRRYSVTIQLLRQLILL